MSFFFSFLLLFFLIFCSNILLATLKRQLQTVGENLSWPEYNEACKCRGLLLTMLQSKINMKRATSLEQKTEQDTIPRGSSDVLKK